MEPVSSEPVSVPSASDSEQASVSAGPSSASPREPTPPVLVQGPALFVNRELSWLEFNERVLAEARNPDVPLL